MEQFYGQAGHARSLLLFVRPSGAQKLNRGIPKAGGVALVELSNPECARG